MWKDARPINEYYNAGKAAGKTYSEMRDNLVLIDSYMAAYGDWYLYQDQTTGKYYQDYFSIGD